MEFFIQKNNRTFLRVNDDPDLAPWDIIMPRPPEHKNIEGYGLSAQDQHFRYQQMPDRLMKMHLEMDDIEDAKKGVTIRELHRHLTKYQREYRDEIQWIKKQHHRLEYGYWFFNNDTPTYMDRDHYGYINYWDVGNSYRPDGLPEYRLRDSIYFLVTRYVELSPYILGLLYYKHRREGATFKTVCKLYFHAIREFRRKVGIQSLSGDHAAEIWDEKFVVPWRELPFFLKAEWNGSDSPDDYIEFNPKPQIVTKAGAHAFAETGLGSKMMAETSGIAKFDSHKLTRYYFDEFGKKHVEKPTDSFNRYMRIKETLIEGDEKVGTAFGTSTIGDESGDEGGIEYAEKFRDNSQYWEIPDDQRTNTGLRILFIPSYVNLGGFTDPFGNPIIDSTEMGVMNSRGILKKIGSKEFLQDKLERIIAKGNWTTINEEYRKFPNRFIDCFRSNSTKVTFDQVILTDRINDLKRQGVYTKVLVPGTIEPVDPKEPFGAMQFKEIKGLVKAEDMDGLWLKSQSVPSHIANRWHTDHRLGQGNKRVPSFIGDLTVSCDPGKYEETQYGTKSKGAITIKRTFNPGVDTPDIKDENWTTDQYILDYIGEVNDIDKFAHEALKACIWSSTMLYGENNIYDVNRYFKKEGFHGYLLYDIDDKGKISANAGFSTQTRSKQTMFNKMSQYISRRGMYEKHIRLLEQAKKCASIKDLTNLDTLASAMGNLLAEDNQYGKFVMKTKGTNFKLKKFYK